MNLAPCFGYDLFSHSLEEVPQAYEVRLVSFRAIKEPAHRALHPFGEIPTYEDGNLALFESGAIVFPIAERQAGLLPDDAHARARAIASMIAALNTMEPPILDLQTAGILEREKPWSEQRLPGVKDRIRERLGDLPARLGEADGLDGALSAGDLLMAAALLRLRASGLLDEYLNVSAYVACGEARPAFKRAFDAPLTAFTAPPPTGRPRLARFRQTRGEVNYPGRRSQAECTPIPGSPCSPASESACMTINLPRLILSA
jgi:glutathione S-transferase